LLKLFIYSIYLVKLLILLFFLDRFNFSTIQFTLLFLYSNTYFSIITLNYNYIEVLHRRGFDKFFDSENIAENGVGQLTRLWNFMVNLL